ncbi:MAG: hypothetical protein RIA69_01505 [Cyclobacteriaceae bacterium]
MKNLLLLISTGLLSLISLSCEEFNALDEFGDRGDRVGNVYLSPTGPQIQAGATRELIVEYWSNDDFFTYTGLWDSVVVFEDFNVAVGAVEYSAINERVAQKWEEETAYPFNFANWNPPLKAYRIEISYTVDLMFDNTLQDNSDISANDFWQNVPEGFNEEALIYFSSNLSRSTLNEILVNTNAVVNQVTFDSYYDVEGNLTSSGRESILSGLGSVGLVDLIGEDYSLGSEYRVTLAFRATNGSGIFNEYRRSFLVF